MTDLAENHTGLDQREWAEPWKGPFLEALSRMPNIAASCRLVGISVSNYKYARRTDTAFKEACAEAIEVGVDFLEQVLHRRATVGEERRVIRTRTKIDGDGKVVERETVETESVEIDNTLLVQLLKAHRPERWNPAVEHRHRGDPENPIAVEVYRRPTPERVLELARIALELEENDQRSIARSRELIEGEAVRVEPD